MAQDSTKALLSNNGDQSIRMVQEQANGISSKYVSASTLNQVRADLLVGLKRFRYVTRWKAYWTKTKTEKVTTLFDDSNVFSAEEGMGTSFRPKSKCSAKPPVLYSEVENFLREVERESLASLYENKRKIKICQTDKILAENLQKLSENSNRALIKTDKTNKFAEVKLEDYIRCMKDNLDEKCTRISREEISDLYSFALYMLDELKIHLTQKEYDFLKAGIENREVPEPMLLLKDHKTTIPTPYRFVLPCRNFTADFAKLGFTAVKNAMISGCVNFEKFTLRNSFDFLERIKPLGLQKDQQLVLSVDAVNMYPSISLRMIKKAVFYYATGLDRGAFDKIIWGLKLVEIAMNSAVCMFAGQYYRYGGLQADFTDTDSVCLSIGSFESAFLPIW